MTLFEGNQAYMDIPEEEFAFVQTLFLKDERFKTKPIGFFKDALIRLGKNKASIAAFWVIVIIVILSIFAPFFNGYGYNQQNENRMQMPPRVKWLSKFGVLDGRRLLTNRRAEHIGNTERYPEGSVLSVENPRLVQGVEMVDVWVDYYKFVGADDEYYWFGTDYLGRDLFTRLFRGARISLLIAVLSVITNLCIGVVVGSILGYYGGKADLIVMRLIEILDSIPHIVIVTMFILFFGTGMHCIVLSLVVQGWIHTTLLVRSQFYRFKGREYVLAARTLGVRDFSLIFRHILPNSVSPVITATMIAIPGAIFAESFLAYIGLGLQPPEPSIGVLLSQGQKTLLNLPFQTFYPALLISVLMISFNMLSYGLRDAFDPTGRGTD